MGTHFTVKAAVTRAMVVVMLLVNVGALIACSSDSPKTPPEYSYTIRGMITQLPSSQGRGTQLMIRHEAIPDFVDEKGVRVGMNEMTMPFTLSSPKLLGNLRVGDEVEFVLEVRWRSDPLDQITAIHKLPTGSVRLRTSTPN